MIIGLLAPSKAEYCSCIVVFFLYCSCILFLYRILFVLFFIILVDPGAVSGGGKMSKRARKNSGEKKSRTQRRGSSLHCVLDSFSPEFFSRPFRLFSAPTNCPWVYEDGFFFLEGNTFLLLEVCGVYFHCFRCLSSRSERLFGGFRRRCCENARIEGTGFNLVAPTPPSKGTERILVCLVTFQLFRRQAAIHRIRRSRSGIPAA